LKNKKEEIAIVFELNRLQILKRIRKFTFQEIEYLTNLIKKVNDNHLLIGIYLLCDNKEMATVYYKKLSKRDRKKLKEMPLSKFWNE
jgi:hypothetical protein